jgi:hypothetical protein
MLMSGTAVERQGSAIGCDRAREHAAQGRLAGSVLAGEPEDLAAVDVNVDAAERGHGAVALRDTARDEH